VTEATKPATQSRSKRIPAWLPPTGAVVLKAWGATWRVREQFPPSVDPHRADHSTRCVYLLWHRTILMACHAYRGLGVCIGVSEHGDGEIGARIAERFGFETARGSSTRGATRLVRAMLDFAAQRPGDLALTPDGPKGPARQCKPGALFLAAKLGWPVVPVALTARPRKELKSWDRFVVPYPFARLGVVAADPIRVESETSSAQLAELCREVDRRMEAAERVAEELVA
jgi:lysophospholipid acyltransferase (LPLAT)-like uncharacterized protein